MKLLKKLTISLIIGTLLMFSACSSNAPEAAPVTSESTQIDLSGISFDTVYGSQLPGYLNRQYYFNGKAISKAESNFYFIEAFKDFNDMALYGYYPMTPEGYIDLSAALLTEDTPYATYGDFLTDYAERVMENTYIILSMAEEEGLTLSDETMAEIDLSIEQMNTGTAIPAGLTMNEYLSRFYGPDCTVEAFREIVTNFKLADLYTMNYIDNYDFSDESIDVPSVRYVLVSSPEGTSAEAMEEARTIAEGILEQATDLEQLEIAGALAYTNGEVQRSTVVAVERGNYDTEFLEVWAYDESRETGDIEMIYSPEAGFLVVGYEGTTEASETTKQTIAMEALTEIINGKIDSTEYEFYSNDPVIPATPIVGETDPVTGLLITPTPAPNGLAGVSTPIRVTAVVFGIAILGGIAYFIYDKKSSKKSSK